MRLPHVRVATDADLGEAARLLHEFNTEFGEPTPPPDALARRLAELTADSDTVVLVAGSPAVAVAVLRLRKAIWAEELEGYLAELYVVPDHRGHGIGRAVMEATMAQARSRGVGYLEIGVDEPDTAARALYESLGFSNREGGPDGPLMYVYETLL